MAPLILSRPNARLSFFFHAAAPVGSSSASGWGSSMASYNSLYSREAWNSIAHVP